MQSKDMSDDKSEEKSKKVHPNFGDPLQRPPRPGRRGGTLRPFVKGQSGNPGGMPRKIVNSLRIDGYNTEEIRKMFLKICAMTREESKTFEKDSSLNLLEAGALKLAKDFIKKGKCEFLEYVIAKKRSSPLQPVQVSLDLHDRTKEMSIQDLEKELELRGLPKTISFGDKSDA
jgi:hypothetical protein